MNIVKAFASSGCIPLLPRNTNALQKESHLNLIPETIFSPETVVQAVCAPWKYQKSVYICVFRLNHLEMFGGLK